MKKEEEKKIVKEPETEYLTTRVIERALSKATRHLTEDEMKIMGFVITVEDGWVIKRYNDGKVERIEEIEKITLDKNLDLS